MTKNEALDILLKAASVAQSKGAFNLAEAKIVAEAVEVMSPKPEVVADTKAPLPEKSDEPATTEAPQA